jgi:hypothetical protein
VCTENLSALMREGNRLASIMVALACFIWSVLAAPFKSKSRLEAENATPRHQLMVVLSENSIRTGFAS